MCVRGDLILSMAGEDLRFYRTHNPGYNVANMQKQHSAKHDSLVDNVRWLNVKQRNDANLRGVEGKKTLSVGNITITKTLSVRKQYQEGNNVIKETLSRKSRR